MEAIVSVDFESADEFEAVLLAVEVLLVGEILLVVEVMLLLLGVDELLSAVGELVVEL